MHLLTFSVSCLGLVLRAECELSPFRPASVTDWLICVILPKSTLPDGAPTRAHSHMWGAWIVCFELNCKYRRCAAV